MKTGNPFIVLGYESPDYFCDRQFETDTLISAIQNQRHVTLISLRRMGKTGLIKHIFYQLQKRSDYYLIYIDILPTMNLGDFIKELSKGILSANKAKTSIINTLIHILGHLRPKISWDPVTGHPAIELDVSNHREAENTLEGLFEYLNNEHKNVVLAIDEFQQILHYPEKNIESLLRANIQKNRHVQLIFSGSQRNLLFSMFQDQSRPFYQSTQIMVLDSIDTETYKTFIIDKFKAGRKEISGELAAQILEWTRGHTYYVQYFCNRLYGLSAKTIKMAHVQQIASLILDENVIIYNNYRNLLTKQQFHLLTAIAKEDVVKMPMAKDFIFKYQLGAASSVKTTLDAVIKKELVIAGDCGYFILDVFFARWLQSI
ncbi:ATP-binding protein [bacterium]|nr:ATP-binding protein [bacterium]